MGYERNFLMHKPCGCPRFWVIDEKVTSSHNLKPVSCEQYIQALETALRAVDLRQSNCDKYKYNPVRAVQRELGISDLRERFNNEGEKRVG